MMSLFSRNTLLAVVVGAVLLALMWYMLGGTSGDVPLTETTTFDSETAAERSIVETLLALRAVSLSGTIFSDPVFQVLKDFGTPIIPEQAGRPNPFAPLGVDRAPSTEL